MWAQLDYNSGSLQLRFEDAVRIDRDLSAEAIDGAIDWLKSNKPHGRGRPTWPIVNYTDIEQEQREMVQDSIFSLK